jgi:two-component system, chemotaxis family, protein-glutamate methylesterase/glutaminase
VPTGGAAGRNGLVVVGASAGGVEALTILVGGLPPGFQHAVAIVLHLSEVGPSAMPEILARAGSLPAAHAVDGERILGGRIYIAPPGSHLTVDGDRFRLDNGPSIKGHRPAIDPLFETAAQSCGSRVVGVILSGMLDDGARGLAAVQQSGGLAIVQDPADASYGSMPTAALRHVVADFVLRAAEIGPLLASVTIDASEGGLAVADLHDEERT